MLKDYAHEIIVGLLSIIGTGVGAYIVVGQKLSYISGQLSQLLHLEKKLADVDDKGNRTSHRVDKHELDLRRAWDKIRTISPTSIAEKELNGGSDHD